MTAKAKPRQTGPSDHARAGLRALRRAREIARMHGTPIYVMKDGKVVALKP